MNSYIALSMVDYILLLHKGRLDKSLFIYFEEEAKNCTPLEANLAIENLLIRYKNVEAVENTVSRFIRAVTSGLEKYETPAYLQGSIFQILHRENRAIGQILNSLKKKYVKILPELRKNSKEAISQFLTDIEKIESIRKHYLKLQYGVFPALESADAPTRCIQLMWHLEDSLWPMLKECRDLLASSEWDFNRFNKVYGQMFFLFGSLLFREEKILFPVACDLISGKKQIELMREAGSYGITTE